MVAERQCNIAQHNYNYNYYYYHNYNYNYNYYYIMQKNFIYNEDLKIKKLLTKIELRKKSIMQTEKIKENNQDDYTYIFSNDELIHKFYLQIEVIFKNKERSNMQKINKQLKEVLDILLEVKEKSDILKVENTFNHSDPNFISQKKFYNDIELIINNINRLRDDLTEAIVSLESKYN